MSKMSQDRTDYGLAGETGERMPKGSTASDTSGERRAAVPRADREAGQPGESGERSPKGAKGADATGERRVPIMGGVGMGMADKTGREADHGKREGHVGEYNDGRKSESNFYKHKKADYK